MYAYTIIVRMAKTTSVVASYSGLYEEGKVDHINCVWPVSSTQQLIWSSIIRFMIFEPPICPLVMWLYNLMSSHFLRPLISSSFHWEGGCQLHLLHIIWNSCQPLHSLSHSDKAQSHTSTVLFVAYTELIWFFDPMTALPYAALFTVLW